MRATCTNVATSYTWRASGTYLNSFNKTCPQSFYQTCTWPLPTLGQNETCQHRLLCASKTWPNMACTQFVVKHVSIASTKKNHKHAQGLFPRWAKAKHAKHASIASTKYLSNMQKQASIASTKYLSNVHKVSSHHVEPKRPDHT